MDQAAWIGPRALPLLAAGGRSMEHRPSSRQGARPQELAQL